MKGYDYMNAKQYLKQAYRLDELIRSNKEELDNLKELSTSVGAIDYAKDRVQTSADNDAAYTRQVMQIVELERAINEDIEKLYALKLEIRTAINEVIDQDEKLLLRSRYLNFMPWDDICSEMNISMRTAHRIHHDALEDIVIPKC